MPRRYPPPKTLVKDPLNLYFAAVLALLVALPATPVAATAILPGFDLFESQPGTSVDLSPMGLGVVPLEGVPLAPALGNTDTIVERLVGSGSPFDPPGAMVTVGIELVALQLKSVSPVDLTVLGGPFIGVFADLHVTIDKGDMFPDLPQPDVLAPSIGSMEIVHDLGPLPVDDFGGSFDSCFGLPAASGHPACATLGIPGGGVFADAIFTVPGGDPSNPPDVLLSTAAPGITLSSTGGTWLHVPAPGYPLDPAFPAGAFFVQTLPHVGPHPVEPAKLVEATKVDSLTSVAGVSGDVDADGVADPGDTVSYTIEITGLGPASDVTFDDTVDTDSTLVPGSVQVTPIAFDDGYSTAAATQLIVPAGTGVLANDIDPDHSTAPGTNTDLTAVGLDVAGTLGTVSNFMADGSFTYDPPASFTVPDSFQYTARDEDTLDSVTTGVVVIGLPNTAPTATDDSYKTLGNTLLEVDLASASGFPAVTGEDPGPPTIYADVLDNDTDAETPAGLTAAVVGASVTAGAVVNMNVDGSFSYTPPVGFTGTDTFDYTVADPGGLDDTGMVSITVSQMIWYVDKDNAGTADGRSATPFASLAPLDAGGAADASDGTGDTIFVFDETAGNTSGGILLETNQILHGNGVALDPAGFNYAGGGDLVASSTRPTIEDTAGDVIVLASGNTVRGLDIGATNGRAVFGNGIAGATFDQVGTTGTGTGTGVRFDNATGTISVTDLDVNSSTGPGIDIQGGSATFTFDATSSITSPSAAAFNVSGGTASVAYPGSITQANNFPAVNIVNHSTGTIGFGGVIGATNGTGLQFSNADGTYNVTSMTGTTTLNGGDAGIDILGGSNGTFTFGNISITDPTGVGVNIDTSTGGSVNYNGTISKTNVGSPNPAVRINAKTGGSATFSGMITANTSTATGINLTSNAGGTFTFSGGLDIDTTSGTGFNATGGTLNVTGANNIDSTTGTALNMDGVTIGGSNMTFATIDKNSTTGSVRGIDINNVGGGTLTVTGSATINGTAAGATNHGIEITNSSGTFTFASVDIDATGGAGVNLASNGGAVNINGGTIGATNDPAGNAVDIAGGSGNVTIAAAVTKTTAGEVVEVTGRTGGMVTLSGVITCNSGCTGVNFSGNTGGSTTFSNTTKTISTGANAAVTVASSGGHAINFTSGGLNINTTSGNGIDVSAGGTINITGGTGTNNTITTTTTGRGFQADGGGTTTVTGNAVIDTTAGTGIGVDIQSTTIGAGGVTFRSVSVNGATVGIDIDGGGTTGFFTVTGAGTTAGSGGTIQNNSQNGVLIENTNNITLTNMNLTNATDEAAGCVAGVDQASSTLGPCTAALEFNTVSGINVTNMTIDGDGDASDELGIFAQQVTNFDMTGVTVQNVSDEITTAPFDEHGIYIVNLLGTGASSSNWHDVVVTNTISDTGILMVQTSGSGELLIDGASRIEDAREGGFEARTDGPTANLSVTIGNTSAVGVGDTVIIDNPSIGAAFFAQDGTLTGTVRNSILRDGGGIASINRTGSGTNGVLFVGVTGQSTGANADITLNVTGNDIDHEDGGAGGTGRSGIALGGSGNVNGTISDNTVDSNDDFTDAFFMNFTGVGTTSDNQVTVTSNTFTLAGGFTVAGIEINAHDSSGGLSVTVTNNTMSAQGNNTFTAGMVFVVDDFGDTADNNVLCVDVFGNNASAPVAGSFGDYGFVQFDTSTFNLAGAGIGVLTEAQIDTYIISNDAPAATTTAADVVVLGTINGVTSCP